MKRQRLVSGENRTFESAPPTKPTAPWPVLPSAPVAIPLNAPPLAEALISTPVTEKSSATSTSAVEQLHICRKLRQQEQAPC